MKIELEHLDIWPSNLTRAHATLRWALGSDARLQGVALRSKATRSTTGDK